MKVRSCFVANSSSCSFTIRKEGLDEKLLDRITRHMDFAMLRRWHDLGTGGPYAVYNGWDVTIGENEIDVSTYMDNFDMFHYVRRLGVPREAIFNYYHSNGGERLPEDEDPNEIRG